MKSATKHISFSFILIVLTVSIILGGCAWGPLTQNPQDDSVDAGTNEDNSSGDNSNSEGNTSTDESEPPQILYYHTLTGLVCDESLSTTRPVAICISNESAGMPQYGLSLADVLIEAPIESGTRFMALFTDLEAANSIGCVRSTRSWLVDMADAFGAISVYNGTTDIAGEGSESFPGIDTIDYLQNTTSNLFYRDTSRTAPYNLMVSGTNLKTAIQNSSWSLTAIPDRRPYLLAAEGGKVTLNGASATIVRAAIATNVNCEFTYNALTETYLRNQNGSAHTDAYTAQQLSFTNLFFLFSNVSTYSSANGTSFTLDIDCGGNGYYISGGVAVNIQWKVDDAGQIRFYNASGSPLEISCGKNYIAMMKVSDMNNLMFQ